jgi:hypothetical protein
MSIKKKVSPKINEDRVANNVFDLENDFHESVEFSVFLSKNKFGSFKALFEALRTKSLKFLPKLGIKS